MSTAEKKSTANQSKRVDWSKWTDYRARRTRQDLEKLCKGLPKIRLQEVFSNPDKVGLLPIHWAAIHNRADLIEFMLDNGSPLRLKCRNKLFADGTALHLAAMNGSIEAAAMLLGKCKPASDDKQTQPKNLLEQPRSNKAVKEEAPSKEVTATMAQQQLVLTTRNESLCLSQLLKERDSEGQTALMRSASPRSRRLDRVRDLLRKNSWSLSGRPAEMALFLISKGADWRETDSKLGMNLMHWAVVHDYDDIVSMLLVLDRLLLSIPAKFQDDDDNNKANRSVKTERLRELKPGKDDIKKNDGYETVDLMDDSNSSVLSNNSDRTANSSSAAGSGTRKPLVSKRERTNELVSAGLIPLQLAIVYGRLKIIDILWREANQVGPDKLRPWPFSVQVDRVAQRQQQQQKFTASTETVQVRKSEAELRAILFKACWANKNELENFIRLVSLKLILVIDLALLALVWMPVYLTKSASEDEGIIMSIRSGVFIVSFCVSLALAFRVMLKNPGYLRKNSSQYFSELSLIATNHQAAPPGPPTKNVSQQPPEAETAVAGQVRGRTSQLDKVEEQVRLLCHRCRCVRSSRSRHCNNCNHCVQDFDHHCIYLGCCIGRRNRVDFLLLMSMVSITAIYGTVLQLSSLGRNDLREIWHFVGLIWVAKYVLIGGSASFFILKRACLGITMYEEIRAKRIRKIFGPLASLHTVLRGSSFWRDSPDRFLTGDLPATKILGNLKEFFGSNSLSDFAISQLWPSDKNEQQM